MSGREDPVGELVALFARLPGIGERTASRLTFHVLGQEPGYARTLGEALRTLHDRVVTCARCGNWTRRASDGRPTECAVCADPRRDGTTLCVVARVPDLVAIERAGTFRGRYHVLHGLLSPLDGVGPESLPLDALVRRISEGGIEEVIVATPLSVDGEATALYVAQVLRPLGVRVTRIASGVPHGGELEFADPITLGRAFEGRRAT
ncbi:MAG: recombination mediator RecR [Myxococcales bacterium]|nr:recombination mediator RecR [Myxococcales bacterium]